TRGGLLLFPYATRFRSHGAAARVVGVVRGDQPVIGLEPVAVVAEAAERVDARAERRRHLREDAHAGDRLELDQRELAARALFVQDRKSTRLNSSHVKIS